MTTKELIREKIDAFYAEYKAKFHQNGDSYHLGIIDGLDIAERFLDTLTDEPITTCNELEGKKTFDDYLKASPSERRKMNMTEILGEERLAKTKRTMEPVTDCHELKDAAEKSARQYYVDGGYSPFPNTEMASHIAGFKAGAEWMKKQMPMPEDTVLFQKGVEEGRRLEREDALTIADVELLHAFLYAVKNNKHWMSTFTSLSDEQYEEVLQRFNKTKEQ